MNKYTAENATGNHRRKFEKSVNDLISTQNYVFFYQRRPIWSFVQSFKRFRKFERQDLNFKTILRDMKN